MRILLIPCGPTDWHAEGRLLGRAEIGLSDPGRTVCRRWAGALAGESPACIFHSADELAAETAALVAEALHVPARPLRSLAEVDVGLWAGLTDAQLRQRYEAAHKQLREDPLSVTPPDGEPLGEAARRLLRGVKRRGQSNGAAAVGFVLRPLALALLRCQIEQRPLSDVWGLAAWPQEPVLLDCAGAPPRATPLAAAPADGS